MLCLLAKLIDVFVAYIMRTLARPGNGDQIVWCSHQRIPQGHMQQQWCDKTAAMSNHYAAGNAERDVKAQQDPQQAAERAAVAAPSLASPPPNNGSHMSL